jgi:hypothetical protein
MPNACNTYTVIYDCNRLLLYTSINLQAPSQEPYTFPSVLTGTAGVKTHHQICPNLSAQRTPIAPTGPAGLWWIALEKNAPKKTAKIPAIRTSLECTCRTEPKRGSLNSSTHCPSAPIEGLLRWVDLRSLSERQLCSLVSLLAALSVLILM